MPVKIASSLVSKNRVPTSILGRKIQASRKESLRRQIREASRGRFSKPDAAVSEPVEQEQPKQETQAKKEEKVTRTPRQKIAKKLRHKVPLSTKELAVLYTEVTTSQQHPLVPYLQEAGGIDIVGAAKGLGDKKTSELLWDVGIYMTPKVVEIVRKGMEIPTLEDLKVKEIGRRLRRGEESKKPEPSFASTMDINDWASLHWLLDVSTPRPEPSKLVTDSKGRTRWQHKEPEIPVGGGWAYAVVSKVGRVEDLKPELREWYDKQEKIALAEIASAEAKIEPRVAELRQKAADRDWERSRLSLYIYDLKKNFYPKWSDQYKAAYTSYYKVKRARAKASAKEAAKRKEERWEAIMSGEVPLSDLKQSELKQLVGKQTLFTYEGPRGHGYTTPEFKEFLLEKATPVYEAIKLSAETTAAAKEKVETTPLPISIDASQLELNAEQASLATGTACPNIVNTYKVTLKDGSVILVKALGDGRNSRVGLDAARAKAEAAGKEVMGVSRVIGDKPVYGKWQPNKIPINLYTVHTQRGDKTFEAFDEAQAIRIAQTYGLEVSGAELSGQRLYTEQQLADKLMQQANSGEAFITYQFTDPALIATRLGADFKFPPQNSVPIRSEEGYIFLSPELTDMIKASPHYDASGKGSDVDKLEKAFEGWSGAFENVKNNYFDEEGGIKIFQLLEDAGNPTAAANVLLQAGIISFRKADGTTVPVEELLASCSSSCQDMPSTWKTYAGTHGLNALAAEVERCVKLTEGYGDVKSMMWSGHPDVVQAAEFLYPEESGNVKEMKLGTTVERLESIMDKRLDPFHIAAVEGAARRSGVWDTVEARLYKDYKDKGFWDKVKWELFYSDDAWWREMTPEEKEKVAAHYLGPTESLAGATHKLAVAPIHWLRTTEGHDIDFPDWMDAIYEEIAPTVKKTAAYATSLPYSLVPLSQKLPDPLDDAARYILERFGLSTPEDLEAFSEAANQMKENTISSQETLREWAQNKESTAGKAMGGVVSVVYDIASGLAVIAPTTIVSAQAQIAADEDITDENSLPPVEMGVGALTWPLLIPGMIYENPAYGAGYTAGIALTFMVNPVTAARGAYKFAKLPVDIARGVYSGQVFKVSVYVHVPVPGKMGANIGQMLGHIAQDAITKMRDGKIPVKDTTFVDPVSGSKIRITPYQRAGALLQRVARGIKSIDPPVFFTFSVNRGSNWFHKYLADPNKPIPSTIPRETRPKGTIWGEGVYASDNVFLQRMETAPPAGIRLLKGDKPFVEMIAFNKLMKMGSTDPNSPLYKVQELLDNGDAVGARRLFFELDAQGLVPPGVYEIPKTISGGHAIEREHYITTNTKRTLVLDKKGNPEVKYMLADRDYFRKNPDGTTERIVKKGEKIPIYVTKIKGTTGDVNPSVMHHIVSEYVTVPYQTLKRIMKIPQSKVKIKLGWGDISLPELKSLELQHRPSPYEYIDSGVYDFHRPGDGPSLTVDPKIDNVPKVFDRQEIVELVGKDNLGLSVGFKKELTPAQLEQVKSIILEEMGKTGRLEYNQILGYPNPKNPSYLLLAVKDMNTLSKIMDLQTRINIGIDKAGIVGKPRPTKTEALKNSQVLEGDKIGTSEVTTQKGITAAELKDLQKHAEEAGLMLQKKALPNGTYDIVLTRPNVILEQAPPYEHPVVGGTVRRRVTAVVVDKEHGRILLGTDRSEPKGVYSFLGGELIDKNQTGEDWSIAGSAEEQSRSETGIGFKDGTAIQLPSYMGQVNVHSLPGSYVIYAIADKTKIDVEWWQKETKKAIKRGVKYDEEYLKELYRRPELKEAIWWDGKIPIEVLPSTYDIIYRLVQEGILKADISKVRISRKTPSSLMQARDDGYYRPAVNVVKVQPDITLGKVKKDASLSQKMSLSEDIMTNQPSEIAIMNPKKANKIVQDIFTPEERKQVRREIQKTERNLIEKDYDPEGEYGYNPEEGLVSLGYLPYAPTYGYKAKEILSSNVYETLKEMPELTNYTPYTIPYSMDKRLSYSQSIPPYDYPPGIPELIPSYNFARVPPYYPIIIPPRVVPETKTFRLPKKGGKTERLARIVVKAKVDGADYEGALAYTLQSKKGKLTGSRVSQVFERVIPETYTLKDIEGAPARIVDITVSPSKTRSLGAGQSVTYIIEMSTKPIYETVKEKTPGLVARMPVVSGLGGVVAGNVAIAQSIAGVKQIAPITPSSEAIVGVRKLGYRDYGVEKHGTHSTYIKELFEAPEKEELSMEEFMDLKPAKIDSRLWRKLGGHKEGIELLSEPEEEETPYGIKNVRTVERKISLSRNGKPGGIQVLSSPSSILSTSRKVSGKLLRKAVGWGRYYLGRELPEGQLGGNL